MSFVTSVLIETGHAVTELPFPPMVYGAIALVTFTVVGLVMFSYQNVSRRHIQKTDAQEAHARASHQITGGTGH